MTVDRHHWEKEARQYVENLQAHPPEEQLGWLRGAYLRGSESIDRLCQDYRDLCSLVLSWPETQQRTLTVEDARRLRVCRICRQPRSTSRTPFRYDFGEEYACEVCLKGEGKTMRDRLLQACQRAEEILRTSSDTDLARTVLASVLNRED